MAKVTESLSFFAKKKNTYFLRLSIERIRISAKYTRRIMKRKLTKTVKEI